jgi:hypothetical protein
MATVLRGRAKVYLADAAIGPSVLLKGNSGRPGCLRGGRSEQAFFSASFTRYYAQSVGFSYWRGKQEARSGHHRRPRRKAGAFRSEVSGTATHGIGDLKGMVGFRAEHEIETGYVITREMTDFPVMEVDREGAKTRLLKIPAPLACYWLGRSELESVNRSGP